MTIELNGLQVLDIIQACDAHACELSEELEEELKKYGNEWGGKGYYERAIKKFKDLSDLVQKQYDEALAFQRWKERYGIK